MRHFSFNLREDEDSLLVSKLDKCVNKSDMIKAALLEYLDTDTHQEKIEDAMKKEKLTLLRMDKSLKAKKIAESHSKARLNDAQRIFIESNSKPVPPRRTLTNLQKTQYELIDYENKRLHCKQCEVSFGYSPKDRRDVADAKQNLFDHVYQKHGYELSYDQKKLLENLR